MHFKTVAIVGRYQDSGLDAPIRSLANTLVNTGCSVLLEATTAQNAGITEFPIGDYAQIGERADLAIVMGGDGTLSEAANGILSLPKEARPTFGFIPAGTGNDFLRDFAITDLESAARVRWSRDGDEVVQVLAARETGRNGAESGHLHGMADEIFDPAAMTSFSSACWAARSSGVSSRA